MSNIKDILKTRKFIYGGLTAIMLVAGVTFYACKKDPENSIRGSKMMGNVAVGSLQEYENYTPNETIIEEKLLLINNCVNDASVAMPNMELKEAVFFLEAYFQLGVCQWQEYAPESVDARQTYFMEIPISTSEGDIMLNGTVLQARYRSLLTSIVTNIFPEYAVNIGDVFVHSLTAENVVLGLEISYGKKGQKGGEYEDVDEDIFGGCYGLIPYYGRKVATDKSIIHPEYPVGPAYPTFFNHKYKVSDFIDGEVPDINMTEVLMQKRIKMVPMGIQNPNLWANTGPLSGVHECFSTPISNNATGWVDFYGINFYNYNPGSVHYPTVYRDHIWNELLSQAKQQGLCSADAEPLEVECVLKHTSNIPSDGGGRVRHDWILKTTYSFVLFPCGISDIPFQFIP